jgi:oligopeptide/dipeptide ABC transporter ATP-binding protein
MFNDSYQIMHVENLNAGYETEKGYVPILNNISFSVKKNIILGIAGESGSGKSTLASVLYNSFKYPGKITGGNISFKEDNLLKMKGNDLRKIRGTRMSFIPQAAMNALNPVKKIRLQFYDVMIAHNVHEDEFDKKISSILELVRLKKNVLDSFPHELSGGMKQRIVIAMSLLLSPEFIILDEPTTGLDVLVEHDILVDIKKIQEKLGLTMIFISHDLSILFSISDEIIMMYNGEIVESGTYIDVLDHPAHPYTYQLMKSIPMIGHKIDRNMIIKGSTADFNSRPRGCYFSPRCNFAKEECRGMHPELRGADNAYHLQRCRLYPSWTEGV